MLLIFAIVGAALGKFPFGPAGGSFLSRPERSTIWLIPVVAVGLAAVLQRVRTTAEGTRWARIGFDAAVFVVALVVLASAWNERALPYAFSGSKEATHFLERHLGKHDVVILPGNSTFTYAVETGTKVTLHATPKETIGFLPVFEDPRIAAPGPKGLLPQTPAAIRRHVRGADRVYVFLALGDFGPEPASIAKTLASDGYVLSDTIEFDTTTINVWRMAPAGSG